MRLRIRGPQGQKPVSLDDTATIGDLKKTIEASTGLKNFDIKYGYPPQKLELEVYQDQDSISYFDLDGQILTITENIDSTSRATQAPASKPKVQATEPNKSTAPLSLKRKKSEKDPPEIPVPFHRSTLVLRVMPDDNSCLFRAFNSAFFGQMDNMVELRSIIAQTIQNDKETYSQVVLEKDPDKYCRWIQNPDAWGGAIELQILSNHFDVEICSIDVQTLRIDKYNEGQPKRVILVYSGIHYDVIALTQSDPPYTKSYMPPEFDVKQFDTSDDELLVLAQQLCKGLQSQGYFTDTAGFSLKCNDCGTMLTGEKGAIEHASATGHTNFGEA